MAMPAGERRRRKKIWNRTFRDAVRDDGVCVRCCKHPADAPLHICPECREINNEWTAAFRADESHCILCRRPRSGKSKHCETHLARARARSRRWRQQEKRRTRPSQTTLLHLLADGARRQTDLAAIVGRSHRVVLRWLAAMLSDGLVDRWRDRDDGRGQCAWVRLTVAGRREVNRQLAEVAEDVRSPVVRRAA